MRRDHVFVLLLLVVIVISGWLLVHSDSPWKEAVTAFISLVIAIFLGYLWSMPGTRRLSYLLFLAIVGVTLLVIGVGFFLGNYSWSHLWEIITHNWWISVIEAVLVVSAVYAWDNLKG